MPDTGWNSIISIGIYFYASQPSQPVGVCVTSQQVSPWECRVVCGVWCVSVGVVWALLLDCGHLVERGLKEVLVLWELSGEIAQTTMELGSVKGPGWKQCAYKCLWETQQQARRGGAWAALFSLIILGWLIWCSHFCNAFIRCTQRNPIGYHPNLQSKPCCLHSQLWWGH